jgi:aminoglycoside/choline kinase family phosphotransferase
MSRLGAEKFDPAWTYQTPAYDHKLILEKECRYFQESFLNGYLGYQTDFEDYEPEFIALAANALQDPTIGFMHRDMQSRNIMLKNNAVYFIDFQGGRIGPLQYDLASLLIDPYVELPPRIQNQLLNYSLQRLSAATAVEPNPFRTCYHYCAISRNLQILGAFAHLSQVAGKKQFEQYIPPAVRTLRSNLTAADHRQFPRLAAVVDDVCSRLKIG